MKVKLKDVIDHMGVEFEEYMPYICRRTGQLVVTSSRNLRDAEEMEEEEIAALPEDRREEMELAYDLVFNFEHYEKLPSSYDVNEYGMMEDFCYSLPEGRTRDALLDAIDGKGAFRRFKNKIHDFDVVNQWYQFQNECYKQKAIEWCRDVDLEYEE
ncbi:UPF0158 family protein [Paenibacillus sp. GCM10027626]|uniref:UPF0158 family protein n=1 Tax=Paenibacillus sp. GCM10027626 TaxID=3273411 RepID=UPI00363A2D6D